MSPGALQEQISNSNDNDNDDLTPASFKAEIRKIEEITAAAGGNKCDADDDDDLTPDSFKAAIAKLDASSSGTAVAAATSFDGYAFASLLQSKWGAELDVDFRPVTSLQNTGIYVAVMPIPFGSRRCRHRTREEYLSHLQGVIEVLEKYDEVRYPSRAPSSALTPTHPNSDLQLDPFIEFVTTTNKVPRANTSPLIAVTYRMNLSPDQISAITNGSA